MNDLLAAVARFGDTALEWHRAAPPVASRADPLEAKALALHATNFELWHHEDAARRSGTPDKEVADRKRGIDRLNDRRNGWIEDVDTTLLVRYGTPTDAAPLRTETPGMLVDRLSVLALRIVHTERVSGSDPRLFVLREQHDDLYRGLDHLLAGVAGGRLRFKVYRQFKAAGQRTECALLDAEAPVSDERCPPLMSAGCREA